MQSEPRTNWRVRTSTAVQPVQETPDLPACAVFTAVEGTLLDYETLDSRAAKPVVKELIEADVPVVPVTAMTMDEMVPIARGLGIGGPMIVEAGGAIARWRGGKWYLDPLGTPSDALLDAICEIERITGADLLVYSVLSEKESARLSGRSGAMLRASMQRHFSEPFILERGNIADVTNAAASLGFSVRRGKRFFYIAAAESGGRAFEQLREELGCEIAIGVGGSPIDEDFLVRTEIPIIVPRQAGDADPQLLAKVPNVILAPAPGPAGWAAAVHHVWSALQAADVATA